MTLWVTLCHCNDWYETALILKTHEEWQRQKRKCPIVSTCNNNDVNSRAKSPLELNNKVLQLYGELTKHNSNLNFILNFTFNFLAKFNSDVLYRIGFNDQLISFEEQNK